MHGFIGKAISAKHTEYLQKELPVGIGLHQVGEDGICTVSPLFHQIGEGIRLLLKGQIGASGDEIDPAVLIGKIGIGEGSLCTKSPKLVVRKAGVVDQNIHRV